MRLKQVVPDVVTESVSAQSYMTTEAKPKEKSEKTGVACQPKQALSQPANLVPEADIVQHIPWWKRVEPFFIIAVAGAVIILAYYMATGDASD